MEAEDFIRLRMELLIDLRDVLHVPVSAATPSDACACIRENIRTKLQSHELLLKIGGKGSTGSSDGN